MSKKSLGEYIAEDKPKPLKSFIVDDETTKQREPITPGEGAWIDNLIEDYVAGYPRLYLQAKYQISSGQVTSHLKARGVPLRSVAKSNSTLMKRLAHLTEQDVADIIKDYEEGVNNSTIYRKYNIHKNGLYNILDIHNIPRKNSR